MLAINGTVRQAVIEDLSDVLELDALTPVGHERAAFLTLRVQSGECHVFECEDKMLGYVTLRSRTFIGRDFVDLLAVAPSVRRRGVASGLLRHAIAISSTARIFTSTNQSNRAMIRLLEKEDWRLSGQLSGIDEDDPELVYYIDSF